MLEEGKGMVKGIIFFIAIFNMVHLNAYIYETSLLLTLEKGASKNFRRVIGCSDYHDKMHPINPEQREEIESLLAIANPTAIKVIVEDLSSPNNHGRRQCNDYFITSHLGILARLSDYCQSIGLDCDNVEYRYCRVAALGPVINNITVDPHLFSSTRTITVNDLIEETESAVQDLSSISHGIVWRAAYTHDIRNIKAHMERLGMYKNRTQSVADFLTGSSLNRLALVKELLTLDSALLDLKMVHSILSSRQHTIVIFAGGSHIERIVSLLCKMGYRRTAQSPPSYAKEYQVNKCLGSHIIQGSFCLKPKPISLKILQDNIK